MNHVNGLGSSDSGTQDNFLDQQPQSLEFSSVSDTETLWIDDDNEDMDPGEDLNELQDTTFTDITEEMEDTSESQLNAENGAAEPSGPTIRRLPRTPRSLIQLLRRHGYQLRYHDDDDDILHPHRRRKSTKRPKQSAPLPAPSDEGRRLMDTGKFGSSRYCGKVVRERASLANRLVYREIGMGEHTLLKTPSDVAQGLIPSSKAEQIINYSSRCYSGQFSNDGNFFFSCSQDFRVRMYDTSNPYHWKYYKTVLYPLGQWTITDASLSPDNRYLAYSSIKSIVCLSSTDPSDRSPPWSLDFSTDGRQQARGWRHGFGIWSIRFSGDGRELVAGTSDPSVCVYDIERRRQIINIENAHGEDVNAVCFGDASSPHVLYSGSDDTLIKVWDRRSLRDGRAAGVFMGHTEGLTYVDSKGDGRYVLSNGKDQTMKLWDLRRMTSTEEADKVDSSRYSTGFDYRFMSYSPREYRPHPCDSSVVTYRGHSVLKTLIRCHFSPPGSTNSRYVYTGSEDGSVYVYNIDATLAGRININEGTRDPRSGGKSTTQRAHTDHHDGGNDDDDDEDDNDYADDDDDDDEDEEAWKTCVRDASWHPHAPIIAATSWNGWGMSSGTCTTHSWNDGPHADEGYPEMGQRVDHRLVPEVRPDEKTSDAEPGEYRRSTRLRNRNLSNV